jgi:DNA-binding NarL/FixJ family response regulator
MKTRIFIVDDHALFRKGLSVLINAEPDMEVCGESDDCAVGTRNILKIKPDLVIVDISLRGNNGIELIKNIKAAEPGIQVVVLSQHDESVYALRVLRVGAKAYVMKQDAATAVIDAIRWIRKGQLYVSENVASQMLNRYAQGESLADDSPVSGLSDRELEVLNLIGSGVPTREIALRLHVSIKTVETHRAHIKSKLNLATASQLIQFCVRWVDRSEHVARSPDEPPLPPPAATSPLTQPAAVTTVPTPVVRLETTARRRTGTPPASARFRGKPVLSRSA